MIINKGVTFGAGIQVGESAQVIPTYSVSLSKNTITENNDTLVVTVNTTNILDSTWLYWNLEGAFNPGQITVTTGYTIVKGNVATFSVKTIPNNITDGMKTFIAKIRTESPTGPVVATSATITIIDSSNQTTGQVAYTTPGTFSWTAPANVYNVSVVCIGGGGTTGQTGTSGGGGGGLGWKNNISVIPGNTYTVVVGNAGTRNATTLTAAKGGDSYFINTSTVAGLGGNGSLTVPSYPSGVVVVGGLGGSYVGDGGGNGGNGGGTCLQYADTYTGGGGGAGGYMGRGGHGQQGYLQSVTSENQNPAIGSGGGGGGGAGGINDNNGNGNFGGSGGGGGGVGILGKGADGVAGANGNGISTGGSGATGGSSGTSGTNGIGGFMVACSGGSGGSYGAGAASGVNPGATGAVAGTAGAGAVRIIWGPNRAFPSTLTTDQPVIS